MVGPRCNRNSGLLTQACDPASPVVRFAWVPSGITGMELPLMPPLLSSRHLAIIAIGLGLGVASIAMANAAGSSTATQPAPSHATANSSAMQTYKSETDAKAGCSGDTVVWHARGSKVFHTSGSRYYGKTKHGSFVCEKAATVHGLHASKS